MLLNGRVIAPGQVSGQALVSTESISFFGGVDPESGVVVEPNHPLFGQSIAQKVLIFPTGKGSTVGSYTLYRLKKNNHAPAAILNTECDPVIAVGCIIAEIPCIDHLPIDTIRQGSYLFVDAVNGFVKDTITQQ